MLRTSFAALALISCLSVASVVFAQPAKGGVVRGFVSTQGRSVRLPGAEVVITNASGVDVAALLTDGDGQFQSEALPPGAYRVRASLSGFDTLTVTVQVSRDKTTDIGLDLPIEKVAQSVTVTGDGNQVAHAGTLASTDSIDGHELDQFAPGGGLTAALRLLASIIEVPGGVSIKGGRPNQAGMQLGPNTIVNPTTGLADMSLPDDAIDSVEVLPNPYAVEYGRFSSGLVVIQTRRAGDEWRARVNNVDPTFRLKRGGSPFDVTGIEVFAPRVEVGGPIVKDRLFLQQSAQYRYTASDVPSRPQDELRTSNAFTSFTRLDANLSPRHTLVATGGLSPSDTQQATLGTFTPPEATVDIGAHANQIGALERAIWTDALFSETSFVVHDFQTNVMPQGPAAMTLLPDVTAGNFFNQQHRDTEAFQLISSLSGSRSALGGLHLFKVGVDVMHSRYVGSSASRTVLIDRADGTLARRLDFQPLTTQFVGSTDAAMFAQDRYQPSARWYLEFGGRIDRDGVVDRFHVTPRIGTAVLLNETGSATLRGGFGLFYERTPSTAGAFTQFESATDTRFASDGVTPLGLPLRFVHVVGDLDTPRSRSWDVAYDYRVSKAWAFHVATIDRAGSRELILNPIVTPTSAQLVLSSTGASRYRELETGVHFMAGTKADVNVTYTRSKASADLNALSSYFDAILWPVIGQNQYADAYSDAPNRLLTRGRYFPSSRWLLLGTFDWRSGLPYSIVNDTLDFVGPRNATRFPTYALLDAGIEHRFKIGKFEPWIGIRAYNALDAFLPADVQANLGSPAFGSFYNSPYRQFRLQVRFER